MKVNLCGDRKLISAKHSAESGQQGKDKLRCQQRRRRSGCLRKQTNHKHQCRYGSSQKELNASSGSRQLASNTGTDLTNTQPAPDGNPGHEHGDEDSELVVNIAIDGLKQQQEENLQSHQREAGCSYAEYCSRARTLVADRPNGQKDG